MAERKWIALDYLGDECYREPDHRVIFDSREAGIEHGYTADELTPFVQEQALDHGSACECRQDQGGAGTEA